MNSIARYGVKESTKVEDEVDLVAEQVRLLGYGQLSAGITDRELDNLSVKFNQIAQRYEEQATASGIDLIAIQERDYIRALPVHARDFLDLAFAEPLHRLLTRLLGDYYILNQANGLINRAGSKYGQSAYHRDLPYQHFVSSRPIAINALFALDDFTLENGATAVIPGTHKQEAFPADETIRRLSKQVEVPRGTFIILDCMTYHAGGPNRSANDRRAVNYVFTIPMLRQQLHFPSLLSQVDDLTPRQRQLLGFGLDEFRTLDAWFQARATKN